MDLGKTTKNIMSHFYANLSTAMSMSATLLQQDLFSVFTELDIQ